MREYIAYIDLKKVIEKRGFLWDDVGNITLPQKHVPISFNFQRDKVIGMGKVEWFDEEDSIIMVTLAVDDRFVPYIDTQAFSISPALITDPGTMRIGITFNPAATMVPPINLSDAKNSYRFNDEGKVEWKVPWGYMREFEVIEFSYICFPNEKGYERKSK